MNSRACRERDGASPLLDLRSERAKSSHCVTAKTPRKRRIKLKFEALAVAGAEFMEITCASSYWQSLALPRA